LPWGDKHRALIKSFKRLTALGFVSQGQKLQNSGASAGVLLLIARHVIKLCQNRRSLSDSVTGRTARMQTLQTQKKNRKKGYANIGNLVDRAQQEEVGKVEVFDAVGEGPKRFHVHLALKI
jgi:hypothetical protein